MSALAAKKAAMAAAAAAAATAHLKNGAINVEALRDAARRQITNLIDATGTGKKMLVIDESLVGVLGLVAEYDLLVDHGVSKFFHLGSDVLQQVTQRADIDLKELQELRQRDPKEADARTPLRTVIYLTRPRSGLMRHIASNVSEHIKAGKTDREFHVFFVPRRTRVCERVLQEEGVYGDITTFEEFQLDVVPFDNDVMSLELGSSLREFALDGDRTPLFYVARALMKLQATFGMIPTILGKGFSARHVTDMLLRMRRELGADEPTCATEIDQVILLDRDVDFVSPLCTQLTYEGLVDEVFGITNGILHLPPEVTGDLHGADKVALNSADKLYVDIRTRNFAVVGPLLNQRAKKISATYEERHDAKSVGQIKDFISKLGGLQAEHASLRLHTNVAEQIMLRTKAGSFFKNLEVEQTFTAGADHSNTVNEHIEELINRQEPLAEVLRLLCLQSVTSGGLRKTVFEQYRRDLVQAYGYQHLVTLNNLEKVGLLRRQDPAQKGAYNALRKSLRLIVDDVNEETPEDIAYVHSGYAPLSVRLIEQALRPGGWRNVEELLQLLPGPTVDERQELPAGVKKKFAAGVEVRNPVTLVFFLGGCTFAELAALRFMGRQLNQDFVVATTKLINGTTMLQSLMDDVENNLC